MLSKQKRIILFLTVCISVRLLFVYIAKTINIKHLPKLGYIGLLIGMGFAYTYFTKRAVGSFGQKIWWNYLRPIHSLLYLGFGILAIQKNSNAYLLLLADVTIGLLGFINNHFI